MKKITTLFLAIVYGCILHAQNIEPVGAGIPGLYVNDVIIFNGELYAGGYFTPGGTPKEHVMKFNGTTWAGLGDGGVSGGMFPFISRFEVFNNKLFMTGGFDKSSYHQAPDFAMYNGSTWEDPKGGLENAYSLVVFNNTLYAATKITSTATGNKALLYRWDNTQGWINLSDSFKVDGNTNFELQGINIMAVHKGKLYAGGLFSEVNGKRVNNIAVWDGTSWDSVGPGTDATVRALATYKNELFVGGDLSVIGNELTNRLASWDGTKWKTYGIGMDYHINTLHVFNDELYIGGQFFQPNRGIMKYDGTNFTAPLTMNGGVISFLTDNNTLLIAGDFDSINGQQRLLIARYRPAGVGVKELEDNTLQVYPNPAANELTIDVHRLAGEPVVSVYDYSGKRVVYAVVTGEQTFTINTSGLAQGVYYLTVQTGDKQYSARFVKQQ
ncbi:MAG TPA: T9SS type A sorting domain-containing protein [Bacteroidia bacterium]|nr:T9SS type A sorting domain-containing protein [Bacteroidia bacterium]